MAPLIARCSLFFALTGAVAVWSGCGGGCGEPPPPAQNSAVTTSGSSGGGVHGGGEAAKLGDRTFASAERKAAPVAKPAPSGPIVEKSTPTATVAVFEEIDKARYEAKVTKALGAVLVVSYTPRCTAWKEMSGALKGLSEDTAGKVAVYRLNVQDPAQAKLLPSGMTLLPVPGFAYYESGQTLAQRQGLPFDRRLGKEKEPLETLDQYQARLRAWLRSAVAAKNFTLPEPK